jgi:hypothetical protein
MSISVKKNWKGIYASKTFSWKIGVNTATLPRIFI